MTKILSGMADASLSLRLCQCSRPSWTPLDFGVSCAMTHKVLALHFDAQTTLARRIELEVLGAAASRNAFPGRPSGAKVAS